GSAIGNQQHFLFGTQQHRTDQPAVAFGGLDADNALGAASLAGIFLQRGALAVAVFGDREDIQAALIGDHRDFRIVVGGLDRGLHAVVDEILVVATGIATAFGHDQADHFLAIAQADAAHAAGIAAGGADGGFAEAHGLAVAG